MICIKSSQSNGLVLNISTATIPMAFPFYQLLEWELDLEVLMLGLAEEQLNSDLAQGALELV